jgi:hypothetical protein
LILEVGGLAVEEELHNWFLISMRLNTQPFLAELLAWLGTRFCNPVPYQMGS